MKWSLKALMWAVACCLWTAQASAETPSTTTAFDSAAAEKVSYTLTACGACDNGCNSCNSGCNEGMFGFGLLGTQPLGDPWKLKDLCGFDYGGWVQVGGQDLNDGAFTGNGRLQNQDEAGNVHLNQLYAYVAKVADGSCGFDWGFRFDSMYGVDGNEGQSFGNINPGHWDYANGFGGPAPDPVDHGPYEIALPQAYFEVAMGDLSTKFGHFYTPIGYEVVTSPNNFFLSRQLTFYNSEPFTHTGVLSTYKISDNLSVLGGWTQGWDTGFYSFNSGSNVVYGFTSTLTDNITFAWAGAAGNFGWRGDGYISSGIGTVKLTDKLTVVGQMDILDTNFGTGNTSTFQTTGITNNSVGAIGYMFYQLTDRVAIGSRTEWYKADGISYQTYTTGLNVKLTPNLILRPEVRKNDSNGDNNDLFNRTIVGADAILTF
ncbi:MAG: porin [Planctomycetales bacterium]|nr:porin [Planctomycetales bacterium]MBN8624096.1 porin [Planctomycetota bacterium]